MAYKLTNPNKVLYAEDNINKQQLADYYEAVEKWMLPYVKNRLLTLVRCPDSYDKCFFQKHFDADYSPALYVKEVKGKTKTEEYGYIKDKNGLMLLPQLGALEIHTWNSKVNKLDYPDMLIFDLDPAPNLPWKKVVAAAFKVKEQLEQLKLRTFVKTTGGKGLHVIAPIQTNREWELVKEFAHVFVEYLMLNEPDKYLIKMTKSSRTGKIYLDYLRNQQGATAIAPYSTRALIHAPVSTPLHWDELTNDKRDTTFTINTIMNRLHQLRSDPWQDFFKVKQTLKIK